MKENRQATENYVIELLETSNITEDEKMYWKNVLSTITEEQIRKLIKILVLEQDLQPLNLEFMENYGEISK